MGRIDIIYNSKDLILDEDLTFLSFNQTINREFTVSEIKGSDLWSVNDTGDVLVCVPLFNCDSISSDNPSDKVLDDNQCIICMDVDATVVSCTSDDTGGIHYGTVECYAFTPYTVLDRVDSVTVYCIVYDENGNTLSNVCVSVFVDGELVDTVVTDSGGVCRYSVDEACSVYFLYGSVESDEVVISGEE